MVNIFMTQAILNQILNQLEALETEELQQLNQEIQKYLAVKDNLQRTAFHKALLKSGLVKELKQPYKVERTKIGLVKELGGHYKVERTERRLVEVQGKPVSETIIEERR